MRSRGTTTLGGERLLQEPQALLRDRRRTPEDPLDLDRGPGEAVLLVERSPQLARAEEEDWSDDATWTERFGRAQSTARPWKDGLVGSSLDSVYNMGPLSSYSSINQDQETSLRDTRRPYPEEPRAGIVEPGATSGRWRRASQAVEALLALDEDLQPGLRDPGPSCPRPPPPLLATSPTARSPRPSQFLPEPRFRGGSSQSPRTEPQLMMEPVSQVPQEVCRNCGAAFLGDEDFCRRCGHPRHTASTEPQVAVRGDPMPPPPRRLHAALPEAQKAPGWRSPESASALAAAPPPPPPLRDARPQRHSGPGMLSMTSELRSEPRAIAGPSLRVPSIERREPSTEPPTFLASPYATPRSARGARNSAVAAAEAARSAAKEARATQCETQRATPTRWAQRSHTPAQEPVATAQSRPSEGRSRSRLDLRTRSLPERSASAYATSSGHSRHKVPDLAGNEAALRAAASRSPSVKRPERLRVAEPHEECCSKCLDNYAEDALFCRRCGHERRKVPSSTVGGPQDAASRRSARRLVPSASVPARPSRRSPDTQGASPQSALEAEAAALRKENAMLKRRLAMHEAAGCRNTQRLEEPTAATNAEVSTSDRGGLASERRRLLGERANRNCRAALLYEAPGGAWPPGPPSASRQQQVPVATATVRRVRSQPGHNGRSRLRA